MRILICGLSKSGTTILYTMVRDSLEDHLGVSTQEVFEPAEILEEAGAVRYSKDGRGCIADSKENEVVKTLFDSGVSPNQVLDYQGHFDKKIFIVRDPRDRFISQIFYRWHGAHRPNREKFERTLRLARYKELNPKDIPAIFLLSQNPSTLPRFSKRQTATYDNVMEFLDRVNDDWFVLKYEDLVDGNVDDLEEYLSFPIRKNVSVDKSQVRVVRSKAYGNWRKWYSEEDVNYFMPIFKKYMLYMKYDFSDWKIEYPELLPKNQGSEYMLRIFSEGNPELETPPERRTIGTNLRALFLKVFKAVRFR